MQNIASESVFRDGGLLSFYTLLVRLFVCVCKSKCDVEQHKEEQIAGMERDR